MPEPCGRFRLPVLPAPDVWHARTGPTLYAVGPFTTVTVALTVSDLRPGDTAGLIVFQQPAAWLGVECGDDHTRLAVSVRQSPRVTPVPIPRARVWLRVDCDFDQRTLTFRSSDDGTRFVQVGEALPLGDHPPGTSGIPCVLGACTLGSLGGGGYAEFDSFVLATRRHG
jgi:hypothetical protein